jgi:FSR family fosmidomycin resistance protein-like MFS transporter
MLTLMAGGFFLQSTLPVNVVFGQAIAPVSAATVSSLMMGFAWGTGGMTVPLTGFVADRIGIEATLVALSLVPLAAAACALPLPDRGIGPRSSAGPPYGPADPAGMVR